jgi:PBP1b-binding outer membrane lipoprotein LpoB
MKKLIIAIFFSGMIIAGCSERKPETVVKKDSTEKMTIKKDTSVTVKKEMKTKTGKEFVIIETKPSYSISDYTITGVGFTNTNDTIRYSLKNPMTTAMLADLDNNGFEELYILTKATGSGSFADILGVASNNDKSFGEINVQEITDKDDEKGEMFSGYMGHDSVYISGNKLIREFPVYKSSGETNVNPTGGRRKIIYTLKPGETSYQLVISGKEDMK